MSFDTILAQMRVFLPIAIPCSLAIIALIFVLYRFILKKDLKTWKLLPGFLFILNIIFIIYLTFLTRNETYGEIDLNLFRSYREAWNTCSIRNWQLIIFNILVFSPLGTLLPLLFEKFRRLWRTSGAGFLFSLGIELSQRITQRGLCEVDDLFHNTLGVLLGYCLFHFIWLAFQKIRWKPLRMTASIVPLLLCISIFLGIFYRYDQQPYGNLPIDYTYQVPLSDSIVSLKNDLELQNKQLSVPVFVPNGCTRKEACLFASNLFDQMGIEGTSRYSYYEDSIVSYRGNHNITVYLKDCSYEYHYVQSEEKPVWGDIGTQVVKSRLQKYGIEIPEQAIFSKPSEGVYQWTVQRSVDSLGDVSGTLTCITSKNGAIYSIDNQLVQQSVYAKERIISETEAYQKLVDGYFQISPHNLKIHELNINGISLTYSPDTKGYYQPVYLFNCEINGEKKDLVIPALGQ